MAEQMNFDRAATWIEIEIGMDSEREVTAALKALVRRFRNRGLIVQPYEGGAWLWSGPKPAGETKMVEA